MLGKNVSDESTISQLHPYYMGKDFLEKHTGREFPRFPERFRYREHCKQSLQYDWETKKEKKKNTPCLSS